MALAAGDRITITYFEPESSHAEIRELRASFRLKAIAPFAVPGAQPPRTVDPHLTPEVPGVTDEASLADWNPPFPFDPARVRSRPPHTEDEDYWEAYRATPKAFVSLATARRLWSSRFGAATSVRVPSGRGRTVAGLRAQLERALDPAALGFAFRPVRRLGLQAARGTTPFEWLFLGFSMFLIAAAVMLVALLARLAAQRRMVEMGVMGAVGLTRSAIRRAFSAEATMVAAAGGAVGAVAGAGFAWGMLVALQSPHWWLPALGTRFLHLAVEGRSLVLGFVIAVVVCVVVMARTVRGTSALPVRQQLAGRVEPRFDHRRRVGALGSARLGGSCRPVCWPWPAWWRRRRSGRGARRRRARSLARARWC
jgi:hypothetical protein